MRFLTITIVILALSACTSIPEQIEGSYPEISPARVEPGVFGSSARWGGVILDAKNKDSGTCFEVLSRDLGMEFIISPSVNVTQEVSIRAGDVTIWDREHKLELFDAILETAGVQRTQRGRVWVFAPSDIRPVVKSRFFGDQSSRS